MKLKLKTWKDIKLSVAQELLTLKVEDFEDSLDFYIEQLAILEDKDPEAIKNLPVSDILQKISTYQFLKEYPKEQQFTSFKHNGKRFGMCRLNELTLAQMVDIEELVNLGIVANMHRVLAVIYLPMTYYNPITKNFKLAEYNGFESRESMFLELDMDWVYGNLLFFYRIVNLYMNNLKDSLMETVNQQMTIMKESVQ